MELGNIYLKTVLAICVVALITSGVVALSLSRFRGWSAWGTIGLTLLLTLVLSIGITAVAHQMVFTTWHRWQNTIVPFQYECLEYDADFVRMRAIYSMTEEEFALWIKNHEWLLLPGKEVFDGGAVMSYDYDDLTWIANVLGKGLHGEDYVKLDQLGDQISTTSYATEMAENGRQLRAYHTDGRAFVSYNAF